MLRFFPYLYCAFLLGCAPKKPDPKNDKHDGSAPLVILEGEEISLNEFKRRIDALPEFASSRITSVEEKRTHLAALTQFEVLAHEAVKQGYAKDPFVVSKTKLAIQEQKAAAFKEAIQVSPEVSPEEILEEQKKSENIIKYGLFLKAFPCAFDKEWSTPTPPLKKIIDYANTHQLTLTNFSNRIPDTTLKSRQNTLSKLSKPGELSVFFKHESAGQERALCDFVMLTNISRHLPDKLESIGKIRAEKWKQHLQSFEK